MRRDQHGREDVLERNVAALLAHAYRPVRVRPAFERELHERFVDSLAGQEGRRFAPWAAPLIAAAAALLAWIGVRAALAPPEAAPGPELVEQPAPAPGEGLREVDAVANAAGEPDRPRGVERQPIVGLADDAPTVPEPVATIDSASVVARIAPPEGLEGLDGLRVTLLRVAEMPQVEDPVVLEGSPSASAWRFDGLPTGLHRLFVKIDGSATWRTTLDLRPGATLDLDVPLVRGVTARGRVVDRDGRPVEGALVVSETDVPLQVLSARIEEFEQQGAVHTTTDPDGRFALGPLEPGTHVLRASAPGHAPAWLETEVSDELAATAGPTLTLRAAGRISGRVTDDFGTADEGAVVVGSLFMSEGGGAKRMYAYDIVDAEGNYALGDLPPGMFVVLVFDAEGEQMRRMTPTQLELGKQRTVDFVADTQASRLSGRLVDAAGEPLAERVLTVVRIDDGTAFDSDEWLAVNTEADGSFRLSDLDPGRYGLLTDPQPGLDMALVAVVEVGAGSDVERRVVVADEGLTGTIGGPAGSPIPGMALLMGDDGGTPVFAGRDTVGADGRFAFAGLPAGPYRLTFFPFVPGVASVVDEPYRVDGTGTDVALELEPGGVLDVRCVSTDGTPIAGVVLTLHAPNGRRLPDDGRLRTEPDGRLRLTALAEGEWTLETSHSGFEPLERRSLVTATGPNTLELTLTPR